MISKKYRLKGETNFRNIFKKGKKIFSQFLGLYWLENGLDISRFGIIVSLKVDKRSTRRNLLKRRLRAILRQELVNIKPGFDILILTNPKTINISFSELRNELIRLFRKAGLIIKND